MSINISNQDTDNINNGTDNKPDNTSSLETGANTYYKESEDNTLSESNTISENDAGSANNADQHNDTEANNNKDAVNDSGSDNDGGLTDNIKSETADALDTDAVIAETNNTDLVRKKRKKLIIRSLRILLTIGAVAFFLLFIDEVLIQPYRLKKSIEKARKLYHPEDEENITYGPYENGPDTHSVDMPDGDNDNKNDINDNDDNEGNFNSHTDAANLKDDNPGLDSEFRNDSQNDPNRDEMGRLIKFQKLLKINEDVKGWIRINNINGENDTKIDYVVVQSGPEDPEYYLTRDWATKTYLKAGSIFLDYASSVEDKSKNLVIHGHNMTSSDDMFHYLINYKDLDFLKEHPVIKFDTIYEEGLWKIFSVFVTPGNNDRGDFFDFTRSTFKDDLDFLEFVYQLRVRSLFNIDDVDINENDRILTLSTCSYELENYRIIIAARKLRDGEDDTANTDNIKKNKNALYPESFYRHYGGKPPVIPTFEAALQDGQIPWYNPMNR